jgi:hypothetical protein
MVILSLILIKITNLGCVKNTNFLRIKAEPPNEKPGGSRSNL